MKKVFAFLLISTVLVSGSAFSVPSAHAAAIQQQAKTEKVIVCNSKSAYAYHSHECSGLSRCTHGTSTITKSEAVERGYRPCKICYK